MNKELTLEHLSGYLPYGLKAEMLDYKSDYVGRQYDVIIGVHQWSKNGDWCLLTDGGSKPSFNHIKPILRPLTDLTKEIEVDGVKFVPINELAGVFHVNEKYLFTHCENPIILEDRGICQVNCCVENSSSRYTYFEIFLRDMYKNEYRVIQKLYKWHFDIHNLIEQGLAIDYNTLNK